MSLATETERAAQHHCSNIPLTPLHLPPQPSVAWSAQATALQKLCDYVAAIPRIPVQSKCRSSGWKCPRILSLPPALRRDLRRPVNMSRFGTGFMLAAIACVTMKRVSHTSFCRFQHPMRPVLYYFPL